ncbi:MAG: thiamine-phosphate kinase [Candidatus Eremiobacter antarcticus]|nr:thiamine-phosphate kinase [Candidatus Eremiobacteraeota bacterium]MBC5808660.1 thiamine-phosphate kinase [Candidatus Eremiobacteraeota bacterium]PZR62148.1 MAG: thiamine-phosphate kinase [Candidatus Eremiobacter sp. RRmetagenome_bin22]
MPIVANALGEEQLVRAIADAIGAAGKPSSHGGARLRVGIGDDAAAWKPRPAHLSLITTDALIEGVHFRSAWTTPDALGHKCLAQSLSDIAAMGGRPVLATIALGVTEDIDEAWARSFYRGVAALAIRSHCAIAGGDIVRAASLCITVTVVGETSNSRLRLRSGARPGDYACVTGALGLAAAGLRVLQNSSAGVLSPLHVKMVLDAYHTPSPRLQEGRFLSACRATHAMMDISDGLSLDLARMGAASGLDACVSADELRPHPAVEEACAAGGGAQEHVAQQALELTLQGGDDFELLAAVEARALPYVARRFRARFGRPLQTVGRFEAGSGKLWMIRGEKRTECVPQGYDHLLRTGGRAAG